MFSRTIHTITLARFLLKLILYIFENQLNDIMKTNKLNYFNQLSCEILNILCTFAEFRLNRIKDFLEHGRTKQELLIECKSCKTIISYAQKLTTAKPGRFIQDC